MKKVLVIFACFILFTGIFFSSDYSELIRKGDMLFRQRADVRNALMAIEIYKKASGMVPDHFEADWRVAKTAHYLVDELKSVKAQKKIVETGILYAKRAIELHPGKAEGYFWLGVNYAKEGQVKGIIKSLFRISPIKNNMRKVIELDEGYEGGGAYIVLGRVYSQVPGIFGGSNTKAEENLRKAMKICKTNPLTYLFLAEVYHDKGEKKKAIKILEDLEKIQIDSRWVPETEKKKREGALLLKRYRRELRE